MDFFDESDCYVMAIDCMGGVEVQTIRAGGLFETYKFNHNGILMEKIVTGDEAAAEEVHIGLLEEIRRS